jgi:putative zinc finger/helix-turn-helix YgiT family protein
MTYATDVKHDGQSYHIELPALRIPKCRACGTLVFSNSVDDQISQALRAQVRLLTPEQIRDGREALGLKGKELAERLGVAAETISRWENGGLIQSRAMDNFLRVYFAVPEARTVLRGAEQGPDLGTTVTICR